MSISIPHRFGVAARILGVTSTLWLGGCASTPATAPDLALSDAALAHAQAAGANEWAPAQMRSAREKLDGARAADKVRDYERAIRLAQESAVDARLAEAKTGAAKAGKAQQTVNDDARALRSEMDRKQPQ